MEGMTISASAPPLPAYCAQETSRYYSNPPAQSTYLPQVGVQAPGSYPISFPTNRVIISGDVQQPCAVFVPMNGSLCPRCKIGDLKEEDNTCAMVCIILLVILFFPIGLLYLLCLPSKKLFKCYKCGFEG